MDIKLVEYFSEHWYKVGDEYYPSVTTKLGIIRKPFLEEWRGSIGNREADMRVMEAQNKGTRTHHAWYTITTGGTVIYNNWKHPTYSETELKTLQDKLGGSFCVMTYQDEYLDVYKLKQLLDALKPRIVASEIIVYSDKYKEAGTIDNVFEIKEGDYKIDGAKPLHLPGGLYIADLKTGKVFDDSAHLQMAAYASMYEEISHEKIVGTLGLHTQSKNKGGIEGLGIEYQNETQVKQNLSDYRLASDLWLRKNKTAKPRTFEFPAMLKI